jgi:hypothetical protein
VSAGRALIAVPLPPPSTWRLLREPDELPEGYHIVGSLQVGRTDRVLQTPARELSHLDDADGVTLEQWRELFALFARMTGHQRAELLEHARGMLHAPALPRQAVSPLAGEADGA